MLVSVDYHLRGYPGRGGRLPSAEGRDQARPNLSVCMHISAQESERNATWSEMLLQWNKAQLVSVHTCNGSDSGDGGDEVMLSAYIVVDGELGRDGAIASAKQQHAAVKH